MDPGQSGNGSPAGGCRACRFGNGWLPPCSGPEHRSAKDDAPAQQENDGNRQRNGEQKRDPRIGVKEFDGVLTPFGSLIPGLKAERFDIIAAGLYIQGAEDWTWARILRLNRQFQTCCMKASSVEVLSPDRMQSPPSRRKNVDASSIHS